MSTASPEANILLDPVSELTAALKQHAFGIGSSSSVILAESFPITPDDKADVAASSRRSGRSDERVRAAADISLREGGTLRITLDPRGYTIESYTGSDTLTHPHSTFESLDALLIAVSPAYVQAMTQEIGARFAGMESRQGAEEDETPEQAAR